jgi:hypothetical protein
MRRVFIIPFLDEKRIVIDNDSHFRGKREKVLGGVSSTARFGPDSWTSLVVRE